MTKVGFVGSGKIGSTSVFATLSMVDVDEIVIVDIPAAQALVEGEAMDLSSAAVAFARHTKVTGGTDYGLLKGCDIVVVSAGSPRKPGMTRLDLLAINKKIIESVSDQVKANAPECIFLLISNPIDVLLSLAYKRLGFPRQRVIGMSSMHDSVRLSDILREKSNNRDAKGTIMGEHGETMLAVPSLSRVPKNASVEWGTVESQVRNRAMQIIERKGATVFAPAACTARMVRAIVTDAREEIPTCVVVEGEYGLRDVTIGLPAILGRHGLERIVEYPLTVDEKKKLQLSADTIRKNVQDALTAPPPAPVPTATAKA
ncbi:MAG TPA: malate dehydrogenase [Candidatus Thermoplasmatota archaeon]|nr:malate dehydrogenase [Candidatus Thermoplasmatota archaeon]